MHVALAPGERLTAEATKVLADLEHDTEVAGVLIGMVPDGTTDLERTAGRYLERWDHRFVHPMNFFAPAARVAARVARSDAHNATAAPHLADAIARGARVEALAAGVRSPFARDLSRWRGHFVAEGRAWGALAARDHRFAPFVPQRTRAAWWRHNVGQVHRRVVESQEAMRQGAPLALMLHLVREAAFIHGARLGAGGG